MDKEIILKDAGGVKVNGEHCADWANPGLRYICQVKVVFERETRQLRYDEKRCAFILPVSQGQQYTIHLHGSDGAHVVRNGVIFVCTRQSGKPVVVTYTKSTVPAANQSTAQMAA